MNPEGIIYAFTSGKAAALQTFRRKRNCKATHARQGSDKYGSASRRTVYPDSKGQWQGEDRRCDRQQWGGYVRTRSQQYIGNGNGNNRCPAYIGQEYAVGRYWEWRPRTDQRQRLSAYCRKQGAVFTGGKKQRLHRSWRRRFPNIAEARLWPKRKTARFPYYKRCGVRALHNLRLPLLYGGGRGRSWGRVAYAEISRYTEVHYRHWKE